ncbi:hypothetical protein [Qipengyuania sphaerica]|uniref:hypothetical protein n=1 Tax=Qipengyuania sphaerica TaxID=2867243 RepID=UPI001C882119|nr:hypothetical protein [Qipengyuania sphaerica]MBX7540711.1 hypothetical protein [Qipengyuania sphaerica]
MPEDIDPLDEPEEGDVMAGDRRIARTDTALPDWYASDTAYRPVPIVWFAGALIMQVIAQPVLFMVFAVWIGTSPWVTIGVLMLASGIIWHLAMERGLAGSSLGWRMATGIMLAFFFAITALTALA